MVPYVLEDRSGGVKRKIAELKRKYKEVCRNHDSTVDVFLDREIKRNSSQPRKLRHGKNGSNHLKPRRRQWKLIQILKPIQFQIQIFSYLEKKHAYTLRINNHSCIHYYLRRIFQISNKSKLLNPSLCGQSETEVFEIAVILNLTIFINIIKSCLIERGNIDKFIC